MHKHEQILYLATEFRPGVPASTIYFSAAAHNQDFHIIIMNFFLFVIVLYISMAE